MASNSNPSKYYQLQKYVHQIANNVLKIDKAFKNKNIMKAIADEELANSVNPIHLAHSSKKLFQENMYDIDQIFRHIDNFKNQSRKVTELKALEKELKAELNEYKKELRTLTEQKTRLINKNTEMREKLNKIGVSVDRAFGPKAWKTVEYHMRKI